MFRLVFTLLGGVFSPMNNAYGIWFLSYYFDDPKHEGLEDAKSLFAVLYDDGVVVIDLLFMRVFQFEL